MLEHLSLASLFNLVQSLWVRPGAYSRVQVLHSGKLLDYSQTLDLADRLPGTNTYFLTFYDICKLMIRRAAMRQPCVQVNVFQINGTV